MQKISGYIVTRDSGNGIPNIVVTAYDCRKLEDFTEDRPTSVLLKSLGRRLSSVLTNDRGWFELTPDDLAFVGNEPRPDLALVAYAPEDITDFKHPFPAPPEKRVLYMSVVPRIDAGAEEVFYIRLPRAQLVKFGIEPQTHRLADTLEGAWQARDSLADVLRDRLTEERERSAARRKLVLEKTKTLSGVPHSLREHSLLALSKADLEERRAALQRSAIKNGMTQMTNAQRPPQMRLYLNLDDLTELGLAGDDVEKSPSITAATLFAKSKTLASSPQLALKRNLLGPNLDQLEKTYLSSTNTRKAAPRKRRQAPAKSRKNKSDK